MMPFNLKKMKPFNLKTLILVFLFCLCLNVSASPSNQSPKEANRRDPFGHLLKNFTQFQLGEAQKYEVELKANAPKSNTQNNENNQQQKNYPNVFIDMDSKIKKRKLGLFRVQGDGVKIHYPSDPLNRFQKEEDSRTFEEDPHLLSQNVKYLHKNFSALNLSTEFSPVSTENLNNDEGHKILELKYDLERETYEDHANAFWELQKEKRFNQMMSNLQKVINRKSSYPESEISGMQFGKYDPVVDQPRIETTYNQ